MRVIISGVQSSGKSTLLKGIKKFEKFEMPRHITLIEEPIRRLVSTEGIKINKDGDYTSQMRILEEHYRNTFLYENFISDRGAVDAFVYAQWSYINEKFTLLEFLKMEEIFLRTVRRYDTFVYLESSEQPVADGVRDTDYKYIKELERLYRLTYDTYLLNNRLIILPREDSTNDRVKHLLQTLNLIL